VRVWLGTSGWQYDDWKGRFYPEKLPQRLWLEHYAERFRTVELNNSFYRLPVAETFEKWRARTPDDFVMVVKASRYLSHIKRLKEPAEPVERLMDRARSLGDKLGPILLQLPPRMPVAADRLDETLTHFDRFGARVAVETRDPSWENGEVHDVIRRHGAALVLAERKGVLGPVLATAPWTFVRFHEGNGSPWPKVTERVLREWVDRIVGLGVEEAWVFFNNDPGCWAIENARMFGELCRAAGIDVTRFPEDARGVARAA
jgi:uncharacterized protein YecE (DUF72 family)